MSYLTTTFELTLTGKYTDKHDIAFMITDNLNVFLYIYFYILLYFLFSYVEYGIYKHIQ